MGWFNQQPENCQKFREKKPRPAWLSALQSYCKSITGLLVCGPELGTKSRLVWVQNSLIPGGIMLGTFFLGGKWPGFLKCFLHLIDEGLLICLLIMSLLGVWKTWSSSLKMALHVFNDVINLQQAVHSMPSDQFLLQQKPSKFSSKHRNLLYKRCFFIFVRCKHPQLLVGSSQLASG